MIETRNQRMHHNEGGVFNNSFRKSPRGFSLIELMIVIAIVGILSAVAYPSYTEYVVQANRVDGQDKLAEIMFAQERFQVKRRRYSADLRELGYSSQTNVSSDDGHYQVSATACSGNIRNCVLLTAAPTPGGSQANNNEPDLTLNSRGERTGPWRRD